MSNNRSMESNLQQPQSVTLTQKEAEEYCAYKRQKKISEIAAAMRRAESLLTGSEDVARTCERAARLKVSAVQLTPAGLAQWGELLRTRPVKVDCVIGGDGETLPKVKAYEAKQAIRLGAKELTLRITPSLVACSRYTLLRKELRRLRKAAGKTVLKARVERILPQATLSRLLRVCNEVGVDYFSLPYFEGCERLQTELRGGCQLEVSGVNTLATFQKMAGAGIGRMVTSRAWDIYCEWVQEVEKTVLEGERKPALEEARKPPSIPSAPSATSLPPTASLPAAAKAGESKREPRADKPLLLPTPSRAENAG